MPAAQFLVEGQKVALQAEQGGEPGLFGGLGRRSQVEVPAHHLQGVGGDPGLETGVAGGGRRDGVLEEPGDSGEHFAGCGLVLHGQAASRRMRSSSFSEERRAITARSTVGSTVRKELAMPEHITPQRIEP